MLTCVAFSDRMNHAGLGLLESNEQLSSIHYDAGKVRTVHRYRKESIYRRHLEKGGNRKRPTVQCVADTDGAIRIVLSPPNHTNHLHIIHRTTATDATLHIRDTTITDAQTKDSSQYLLQSGKRITCHLNSS